MDDDFDVLTLQPRPTAARPLLGLTVLVVEDSRYSSEALRQMCLRSGARIRRADCVASAQRHLNVYRPSAAIVDLGLPDGSGLDLIAAMHAARPRVPILLGTSGAEREAAAAACTRAGANGFLPKPVASLAAFQSEVLRHLPEALRPSGPRDADVSAVSPDPLALREDFAHAMDLLALEAPPVGYLRRFLIGLARSAEDDPLERSALAMDGGFTGHDRLALRAMLSQRIQALPVPI
ncbi:response regulator [Roseibacterium sp. SDUM158016]|jgi:CheY-like chemotaxis protein|uniref:response regulator n=1 Tax=Roseicyclus sediminis TaxID=2980997 RepID=UPI0021D1FEB9|nr:response regulator [Roseibacterium sp. SDUM158016]MCU4653991.1 response regulator [Roseibacterium sp. SDUM158016]